MPFIKFFLTERESWDNDQQRLRVLHELSTKFIQPTKEVARSVYNKSPEIQALLSLAQRFEKINYSLIINDETLNLNKIQTILDIFGNYNNGEEPFFFRLKKMIEEAVSDEDYRLETARDKVIGFVKTEITQEKLEETRVILQELNNQYKLAIKLKELEEKEKKIPEEISKGINEKTGESWTQFFKDRIKDLNTEIDGNKNRYHFKCSSLSIKIIILRIITYLIPTLAVATSICSDFSSKEDLPKTLPLLLIFALVTYHLRQALREMAVLRHLRESYRHREIVAKTFNAFSAANIKDDKIKSEVAKEAAIAMFRKESYGYLSKNQMELANSPMQEVTQIFTDRK